MSIWWSQEDLAEKLQQWNDEFMASLEVINGE